MAQVKLKIKTGDNVLVIAGNYKGKQGNVRSVNPNDQRVIVEGINMAKRHIKPTTQQPQGSIVEKELSIHISNLSHIDKAGKPAKVGRKIGENGKIVRYFKKSGEVIK
jgi:large subunit ribosomal protein L24